MRYQVFVGETSDTLHYLATRSCHETACLIAREYVNRQRALGVPMTHILTAVRPHPDDLGSR
jgi:hypothetical protein